MGMLKLLLQPIHLQRKIDSIKPSRLIHEKKKKKEIYIYIVAIKTLEGLNICIFMFRKFIKVICGKYLRFHFLFLNYKRG